MRFDKLSRRQAGDTIVEVLLCLAVIAGVLTVTFASANKNSQTVRRAQERAEALQQTQGQVEILKQYIKQAGADTTGNFCLDFAGATVTKSAFASYTYTADPALDDFTKYTPVCVKAGLYHLQISRAATFSATNPLYLVQARWDGYATNKREQVIIEYKVYQ